MSKKKVDLIIKHANQIVTVRGHSNKPAGGSNIEDLGIIEDGAIAILNGEIIAVSASSEIESHFSAKEQLNAEGKAVIPGFIDAHTHFVFAGSRENELAMKIKGISYMEILQRGGGILKTVRDTRAASKSQLLTICKERGLNLLIHGTTTAEAKSGYGLTLQDEIKSLEIIHDLNRLIPLTLIPTFLAHAIPPEYQNRKSEYVSMISEIWIPEITRKQLAKFCDVFCEKDVFEIDDSRRILESGKRHGLLPRIHADEFYPLNGAQLAAEVGAVSADHLLQLSSEGLDSLKRAGVIATLLPSAPLTLMLDKYAEARKIISADVPIALGSDLSPSCWIEDQQLVIALACYKLRMTPAEALVAATINAAHTLKLAHKIGSIEPGKTADLLILNVPNYESLGYRLGTNLVDTVLKNGTQVVSGGKIIRG